MHLVGMTINYSGLLALDGRKLIVSLVVVIVTAVGLVLIRRLRRQADRVQEQLNELMGSTAPRPRAESISVAVARHYFSRVSGLADDANLLAGAEIVGHFLELLQAMAEQGRSSAPGQLAFAPTTECPSALLRPGPDVSEAPFRTVLDHVLCELHRLEPDTGSFPNPSIDPLYNIAGHAHDVLNQLEDGSDDGARKTCEQLIVQVGRILSCFPEVGRVVVIRRGDDWRTVSCYCDAENGPDGTRVDSVRSLYLRMLVPSATQAIDRRARVFLAPETPHATLESRTYQTEQRQPERGARPA